MKKIFCASLLILSAMVVWQRPVQAVTIFYDDMDSGVGDWTADGLWHLQSTPEAIAISGQINPSLVSLPDAGNLPEAYSGSSVWWYGAAADGTFMGTWTQSSQVTKNGGWSNFANSGSLISPAIDLTDASNALLSFSHWWEIEGVDVDIFDVMKMFVSIDGGQQWTQVASLNPANDVDGEAFKPYSSGGLGQVGEWLYTTVDLSTYVGETVQLQFTFDTVDEKYNGFRGWLIDDVRVTDDEPPAPSFDVQIDGVDATCAGELDGVSMTPAQFYIPHAQAVQVTSDSDWYITPVGVDDYVAMGEAGVVNVYLNEGFYELSVVFTADQTCPDAVPVTATVTFDGGASQPLAQPDTVVSFYGSNFAAGSTVVLTNAKSTASLTAATAVDAVVVSSTEIQVTAPFGLANGLYNLKVTTPGGKTTTLTDAITMTSDAEPDIISISPEEINDAAETTVTITGRDFVEGAVATVGGVPITNLTVTDTTITGTVLAGAAAGFQNVVVINPDGQLDKLVGGASVTDTSADGYAPGGTALTAPGKVKGVTIAQLTKRGAYVQWNAVDGAETYVITLLRGKKTVRTLTTTEPSKKITGLKTRRIYKVQVRAYSIYLGGKASKTRRFTTL